jgi:alkylation response protein AidB-like acyl-CoA dehydrogenase
MTDLLYTEVETSLRDSVRSALARRSPLETVLRRLEAGEPYDGALWRTLAAEMGLAGMAVPEQYGGGGGTLREAAVVLEELGRGVAPVPFLTSAVVATAALVACGEAESSGSPPPRSSLARSSAADLLAKLAAGETVAALTVPFSVGPGMPFEASVTVDGDRLTGRVGAVAGALGADVLLVPTAIGLYAVDADAEGVARTPMVSLDLTRPLADVSFEATAGRRVGEVAAVSAALTAGAALLASEQLGLAEWCLTSTVDYVKARHQFGRPVGSFQALKHRLADVWADVIQARAVARYAAGCAATDDPDLPVAASLAQAFCSPVAVRAAEECVQMHGGIGFTWEHPPHLFLKRAKSAAIAYGTADRHRQALGALVDLRP